VINGDGSMGVTDLSGKIAIVTGAAGGFGRALVKALVECGVRVAAFDVDTAKLKELEATCGVDEVFCAAFSIGDPEACATHVQKTVERFGGLHILVNNAAVGMSVVRPDHFTRTVQLEDIDVKVWQHFIAVNLSGAFFLAKAAVPIFRKQRFGRIINVTTSFFTMINPGFSPYGPAKAGLEAWTASLAGELKGTGITVNVLIPGGPADTPMVPPESGFDRSKLIAPHVMAPPMLWLCSGEASGMTGQRYVAAEWDSSIAPAAAARIASPAAWPTLTRNIVWPNAKST
jgi:NAD(P)-dependent dehydrogenase (short-subunit alcohol dehydrogenase family)